MKKKLLKNLKKLLKSTLRACASGVSKRVPKFASNTSGFTLTEVLVGVFVLSMSIVAAANFLVSMIHSNSANTSHLQAYYYSQEGLEAFRNMRDTHFMNNLDFCGKDGNFWRIPNGFSDGCEVSGGGGASYIVNLNANPSGNGSKEDMGVVSPWILSSGGGDGAGVEFQKGLTESVPTDFKRICTIEPFAVEVSTDSSLDTPNVDGYGGKAIQVTCTTSWGEGSDEKSVSLSTILTDWKHE